jgi:RNA polymerase sigma-70 factor (ECF subfamily)
MMGTGDPQNRMRFEQEALPHLDALFTTALHLTRNRDDASDLSQETMLRAYRFFYQFRPGTDCRAWLLTIMYNTFRSGYARRQRGEKPSASAEEFERALEKESNQNPAGSDPEELLARSGLDPDMEKALHSLPEEFRTALLLVDVNELSYEEAAQTMEVPIGTVRSRLSRARAMMRYALEQAARTRPVFAHK